MATKKKSKSLDSTLAKDKKMVDSELKKSGLTYGSVAGAVILIIGILLILFNLAGILMAVVGVVLVYFGLKMLGWKGKL